VITPRITRLLRVPDLQAMHAAIAQLSCTDAVSARACAVLVPTRGAAEALRRTLENLCLSAEAPAVVLPDIVTRTELYERLHERTAGVPPRLSELEREVIFRRAALDASARGTAAPFKLRPGLIVEILAFYDELRRRDRTTDAFERLMFGSLEGSAEIDRGAERLLRLTRFLGAAFRVFEDRVEKTGRVDEHGLRALLIDAEGAAALKGCATTVTNALPGSASVTKALPRSASVTNALPRGASDTNALQGNADATDECAYRHVIVTVPDQAADARGLWLADYDLLTRMPGLEQLDVIATENVLAAGFHQRVHDVLPGIEEERMGIPASPPVLSAPDATGSDEPVRWTVCRDREEELVEVARAVKRRTGTSLDRSAVVFQRPLPYLYLARQVFADARVPYQALDSLPLAAEPFAAALDLVLSFVISEATRGSAVELLGSPHWVFEDAGRRLDLGDRAAADELWRDTKYLGGWDRLSSMAQQTASAATASADAETTGRRSALWTRAAPALRAAAAAAAELRAVVDGPTASAQVSALIAFISAHERLPRPGDEWYAGHLRARAAVMSALESLRDAHRAHDDEPLPLAELLGTVRRWIEGQTFSPRTGDRGLVLIDAPAAPYADLDDVRLAGMVESDWPERVRRNIFYPSSLLTQLGWPAEADRLSAARARFHDLLALPKVRVSASTFTLEEDAIVAPSPFLEELDASGLPVERTPRAEPSRMFLHEALAEDPVVPSALSGVAAEWMALRSSRSPAADRMYHGAAGVREPAAYAVSRVERYLECPFKYYASNVLKLQEERDEESGLTPQEQGQFLHDVFEAFFAQWQAGGGRGLTNDNVTEALALFERVADARLETLPEADRALERTHLLGSAAAPGLAERAFAFEIEQGGEVIERLLEHALEGEFVFKGPDGPRKIRLRAKADRIDLLADGTFRIVDYKLGKAPKSARALQLPVYGVAAEQHLEGRHGRSWTLSRAGYVAFRERSPFTPLGASSSLQEAVDAGQERLLEAIDGIERGEFPPQPDEPFICTRCGFASVCRKDYVGDE